MTLIEHISREIRESAKWATILIVPFGLLVLVLAGILGGIEGGGKLLLLAALAPTALIHEYIDGAGPVAVWGAIVLVEYLYFFLIVFFFRIVQLHMLCKFIVKKSKPLFQAKPPQSS